MIDITGVDLIKLAQKAYELSSPKGLGFIHFDPDPLTEEEAEKLIYLDPIWPLYMDYVKGRSCKLTVFSKEGKLFIDSHWHDHTNEDLMELLSAVGIKLHPNFEKHNPSCECESCLKGR